MYNVKIIDTKTSREIWVYSLPIVTGIKNKNTGIFKRGFESLSDVEKMEAITRRERYYKNKRWEVSRLVNMNFDTQTKFFTLTFAENLKNIEDANLLFDKFIKRLKYYLKKHFENMPLKYLATWERQKRGAIHYHIILFSFPFIKKETLCRIWGHGFIKINKIENIETNRVGIYVSKYFAKDLDQKEQNKKSFFKSRNLLKPIVKKLDIDNLNALKETIESNEIAYHKDYVNQYFVDDKYRERTTSYYVIEKTKKVEHSLDSQEVNHAMPNP